MVFDKVRNRIFWACRYWPGSGSSYRILPWSIQWDTLYVNRPCFLSRSRGLWVGYWIWYHLPIQHPGKSCKSLQFSTSPFSPSAQFTQSPFFCTWTPKEVLQRTTSDAFFQTNPARIWNCPRLRIARFHLRLGFLGNPRNLRSPALCLCFGALGLTLVFPSVTALFFVDCSSFGARIWWHRLFCTRSPLIRLYLV